MALTSSAPPLRQRDVPANRTGISTHLEALHPRERRRCQKAVVPKRHAPWGKRILQVQFPDDEPQFRRCTRCRLLPAVVMDHNQLVTCDNGLFQLPGKSPGQAFRAVPPTIISGGKLRFSVRP